jgi:hypothetical protein
MSTPSGTYRNIIYAVINRFQYPIEFYVKWGSGALRSPVQVNRKYA